MGSLRIIVSVSITTKMRSNIGNIVLLISLLSISLTTQEDTIMCQDIAWEKVRGAKPEYIKNPELLYTGVDSHGIVVACFEKCISLNCSAFIIDLEKSSCYSVETNGNKLLVFEPNVTFYHKICLKVPEFCMKTKYWQVERSLGSVLLDSAAMILPQPMSRLECLQMCIDRGKDCKAVQFRASLDFTIDDNIGNCALLSIERATKPQAYRASYYRNEYLEHQCHNISKTDFCSYAEYRNTSLPYSDLKVDNLNSKECEQRCDECNDGFLCRAYGIEYSNSNNVTTCFLYSEDTIGAGVSSLVTMPNSFYKEREPCIDMSVRCTNTTLTIELRTSEPFVGRMYANGYSETCGVQGQGENTTILILSLPNTTNVDTSVMTCGLTPAFSLDENNQTKASIWSTVIIQFNPIIQRLGDQAVRVGCSLEGGDLPGPQNVTVNSGFTFIDSNAGLPPIVSTVMNKSSEVPTVTMNILDARSLRRANVTQLGQKLILKIQMTPNEGPFDMMAVNLVASTSSGDSSLSLIDEMGCNITSILPALQKDPTDNRSLVAQFEAFKFPSSQHVLFNAIVKFCLDKCEPVRCGNDEVSYGRKRRSSVESYVTKGKVTELYKKKLTGNKTMDELPIRTQIIVQDTRFDNSDIYPNPLRAKNDSDSYVIAGSEYSDGRFCMDSSLALLLLVFLLIIQIILIGSCVLAVRTYRRMAIRAEEDRADILARHLYGLHGDNFEISRRVHWADNNSSMLTYYTLTTTTKTYPSEFI